MERFITILPVLAAFVTSSCSGSAQTLSENDKMEVQCHAAVASLASVKAIMDAVKSGEKIPEVTSFDELPVYLSDAVTPSIEQIETKFSNSASHLAFFHSEIAKDLGVIMAGLENGDVSSLAEVSAKSETCKDDYRS